MMKVTLEHIIISPIEFYCAGMFNCVLLLCSIHPLCIHVFMQFMYHLYSADQTVAIRWLM